MKLDKFFDKIYERLMFYIPTIIIYTYLIFALRKNNHFFGLNESSNLIDCMYYTSIVFTGSGYGEIYPQTQMGRIIILSLSLVKLLIIIYPIESLNEYFTVENTDISLDDVENIVHEISNYKINTSGTT
tara:strand:- start:533 stop:919 length:387 start_codon:yes stop_codon:yes gene_type:complete